MPINSKAVEASGVEPYREGVSVYVPKKAVKEIAVIVDDAVSFRELLTLFRGTNTFIDAYTVIPKVVGELMKEAVSTPANRPLVRRVGHLIDFSGLDTSSVDGVVIVSEIPTTVETFMSGSPRVCRELGRIVAVTKRDLDPETYGKIGVAALKNHPNYGFYSATVRKIRTTMPVVASRSRRRRKSVKRQ